MVGRLQHETSEGMAAMKISFKNPRAYRNDIFWPQHVFCLTLIASAALSLVAYRVLGNHEEAEEAVQNCLRTAADNVPRFEHEGAFRCWLVRALIDEAVLLLSRQSVAPAAWSHYENKFIVSSKTPVGTSVTVPRGAHP